MHLDLLRRAGVRARQSLLLLSSIEPRASGRVGIPAETPPRCDLVRRLPSRVFGPDRRNHPSSPQAGSTSLTAPDPDGTRVSSTRSQAATELGTVAEGKRHPPEVIELVADAERAKELFCHLTSRT